ncbi:hypothetical protein [Mesorhizobium sp.]|jgi:UDP-glucose 6-dehydrogenase|uniref:hypothetical protein n=1 Tax=Mesorhizobium sp. TaxID=1871066 RepID=UPI0025BA8F09|nr:hypothetical protein [Mesorhizobium sp.]
MRLTVIGQVVGLVSDACFTDFGCVDLDDKWIDALKGGEMPSSSLAPGTLSGGLI